MLYPLSYGGSKDLRQFTFSLTPVDTYHKL